MPPPPAAASFTATSEDTVVREAEDRGASVMFAQRALKTYLAQPELAESREKLVIALRAAAAEVARCSPRDLESNVGRNAREFLREVTASGVQDAPVSAEDLALARSLAARGAAGLLGAMLLTSAWQWPDAPAIARVPAKIMADYAAWIFAAPQGFVARGHAERYPARMLHFMEELLRFARGPAAPEAVRDALMAFLRYNCVPLYFCAGSLRRHYEVRAQILQCAITRPAVDLLPQPRAGRRLRVGFINRHFGSQTETYTTLPTFEQLDPERFEVLLFAHAAQGSALENYARGRVADFRVLPADPREQVDQLRAAGLDVAVFGTNVTAVFHEVTRLALHRVAPLQVVNNSSCTTTGLPEIDLYVSGTLTESADAPAHFSERLGLVAGPAHAFNYEADRSEPTGTWTRAALGLPEDAIVFVTAANYFKIIPEMREAWVRLLAAVPGSRLLVHPFNPNWSSDYPIRRFAAEFDRVLAARGVATDRLVISTVKFPSRNDVKELLRVGDIYLDTFPFGGVNSLVDPLELGLPVVAWEGGTFRSRMGGALLRALGLDELIATDEAGYLALATQLAGDAARRADLKTRINERMGRAPLFLDPLAASDAFGVLIETAFDELAAVGRAEFRRRRTPVRVAAPADPVARVNEGVEKFIAGDFANAAACARDVLGADPANPAARHLLGATLMRTGQAARAVDYFLGAIQHSEGNAPLWHDLAVALGETGRPAQAVQALETSLRLDPNRLDGWLLMAELARGASNRDLLQQALGVARRLAPDDPRILPLANASAVAPVQLPARSDPLAVATECLHKKDWAGAEGAAREALAAKPESADVHHALGLATLHLGKSVEAIRLLDRATQLAPRRAEFWQSLGGVLLDFDAHAKARVMLENAVRLDPARADAWSLLGEARLREQNSKGAEQALARALELKPAHPHALMWLGHVRKRAGRLLEALRLHRRAVGAIDASSLSVRARPRVVFVVQHGPMWTTLETVYEAFAADPRWETILVAVPYVGDFDKPYAILDFLRARNLPFVRWDEFKLEPGCADIMFLPMPHDHARPPEWRVPHLLKFVPRLAYVPYTLEIQGGEVNATVQWNLHLQQLAWMIFARSPRQKAVYANQCASGNAHVVVTGHPKMDAIRRLGAVRDPELDAWVRDRKAIVWNAQYDVRPDGTPFGGGCSTFMRWKDFLPAEFARRPGLGLIIRPHPIFAVILAKRNVLTEAQVEEFFARCNAVENIHVDRRPSYLPAFAASSAIMSDASSFLLEYAATGRPVLYLRNPRGPGLNADGEFVENRCYIAETEEKIRRFLDMVEVGEDPRGDERRSAYRDFMHLPPDGVGVTIKRAIDERLAADAAESGSNLSDAHTPAASRPNETNRP